MTTYLIRRLLLMVVTLAGISVVVFVLTQMVPGGPVEQAITRARSAQSQAGGSAATSTVQLSPQELENIRAYFGFDKPIHVRYATWVGNMLRFDFGQSYDHRKPVWEVVKSKFPISIFFGLTSWLLTYLISVPLGIVKALKDRSAFDTVTSLLTSVGYVIPGYVLGVFLIVFFAGGTYLKWFPTGGITSEGWAYFPLYWKVLDFLHHMVLPLICYVIGNFAVLTLLMKNSLLEELNKDYIRTALAKGVSYRTAVVHHAVRNSLIPLVTGIGSVFTIIFTGSLLIEKVFEIDGMGRLVYDSMVNRDYNVVLAIIMLTSLLTLIGRLVSDLAYVVVDPRINLD